MSIARFVGSNEPRQAAEFIQHKFEAINRNPEKAVHTFIASLYDREVVKEIVKRVADLSEDSPSKRK